MLRALSWSFWILFILKTLFLFLNLPPVPITETITSFFAYSLPKLLAKDWQFALEYGLKQGYYLFWVPTLIQTIWFNIVRSGEIAYYVLNWVVFSISVFTFGNFISKSLPNEYRQEAKLVGRIVFISMPWNIIIAASNLGLLITLACILLGLVYNRFFLLGAAFSSWQGLIFSSVYTLTKTSRKTSKLSVVAFVLFLVVSLANRSYIKSFIKSSYLYSFTPVKLTEQVNETQKNMFLATNKVFMMPAIVRKFSVNKVETAASRFISHGVSYFDSEQLVFPLESYTLLSMSGLSPKGNISALSLSGFLLLLVGLYLLASKKVFIREAFIIFLSGFLPYFLFEKKHLLTSAYLTVIPFLLSISFALTYFSKKKHLIFWSIFMAFILESAFFTYSFIRNNQSFYPSHAYLAQEIAALVRDNPDTAKVVTTRFGPTHLTTAFYLNLDPLPIWNQEKGISSTAQDITFRPIDLKEELKEGKKYIGLMGEFSPSLPGLVVEKQITDIDEVVYKYGNELWLVTY